MFISAKAPEIRRILEAAGIEGKANGDVSVREFSGPVTVNSYWDGGSKDEYAIVDLVTYRSWSVPTTHPYFDRLPNGDRCGNLELRELPPNTCLVHGGYFCGKKASYRISFRPENLAKLLPNPNAPKVSPQAMVALGVIAGLKGGAYRADEFRRHQIGPYGPANPLVVELQQVGFVKVNKAGAIAVTTEGRNARQ